MKSHMKDNKKYLNTRMARIHIIGLIIAIIYMLVQGNLSITNRLAVVGVLSAIFLMILVESSIHYKEKLTWFTRRINLDRRPKVFEFGFFFFLFAATLAAGFAAAGYYIPGVGLDVFYNSWYFSIFYGFAFTCGYYHYIRRIDDD